jgi:hypothetical protein
MSIDRKFRKTTPTEGEVRLPCANRAGRTKHAILFQYTETGTDGDARFSVDWTTHYQVVQCLGCDEV